MNPYVTPSVAQAIMADRLASAEAYRQARAARVGRTQRKVRRNWPLPGRRYRRVELTWPDGVSSVVSVPEPEASRGNQERGLADSRR